MQTNMQTQLQHTRLEDLPFSQPSPASPLSVVPTGVTDLSLFLGTWTNTNPAAPGIVSAILSERDDGLGVRIFGAGDPELHDWGEVPATVYADAVDAHQATSFTAVYDLGFMHVQLQTYLAKGVLVIANFTSFTDSSGRTPYFAKEFFYRP